MPEPIYFIHSTVFQRHPFEEFRWQQGYICYVREPDLVDAYRQLMALMHRNCKDRDLLTTVGRINGANQFKDIYDAETTDIVFKSDKSHGEFSGELDVIDAGFDFEMFRSDITELVYDSKQTNFRDYKYNLEEEDSEVDQPNANSPTN